MNCNQGEAVAVQFSEALKVWTRIGCLSFGGPAGQIALMHRELVEQRGWMSEKEYLSALNFCMLLPGPEAMQLVTYAGWRLHGVPGGLVAGLLFVLPGALVVLCLSVLYSLFGTEPFIESLFYGVKAAVLVIVIEALLRVAKRALKLKSDWIIAALAFVGLYCFSVPFPLIILMAALFGIWRKTDIRDEHRGELPTLRHLASTAAIWAAVWLVPLALLIAALGPDHIYSQIAIFFSKLAVVTFGGAYAVLSYMGQAAVEDKSWLTQAQMIDGLGLAETTPGPLILVTQFVGYLAAYGKLGTIWAGITGAIVTLWMTFAPCFLFIFVGAPCIEAIGKRPRLAGALAAITAAVVGVILNLSLWFGLHVLFGRVERAPMGWFRPWLPEWSNIEVVSLALSLVAALALMKFHAGLARTLALTAALGLVTRYWL